MPGQTAVQFGAGNIGRGFIAQLFHEAGLEVVFVDVAEPVVAALNARREYAIRIVGPGAADVPIRNVRAVSGKNSEAVAEELTRCAVASTAVGADALRHIAPVIAAGLVRRHAMAGNPLNLLVCENLHHAGRALRDRVAPHLPEAIRTAVLAKTGFVQAVVARMVPLQSPDQDDPLTIRVEAYKRLPVDESALVPGLPRLPGVEPVRDFDAWEAAKLYLHNGGHAILGYLGCTRGHEFGYEALRDPSIRNVAERALEQVAMAMARHFGMDAEALREHVADLLLRFQNEALGDTCFRLARDPIRKLAPDDRLVGAARLVEQEGGDFAFHAAAIAAALAFRDERDPVSIELMERIANNGAAHTLRDLSGIRAEEPLGQAILAAWNSQRKSSLEG